MRLASLVLFSQISHRLDMGSLGKHVQRNNLRYSIDRLCAQDVQIPSHSRRIARHVDDLCGTGLAERIEVLESATFSRWVEYDGSCLGGEAGEQSRQQVFSGTGDEFPVFDAS